MSSFSLVLSDGTARDYTDLNFCDDLKLNDKTLKCGKFHPQLRFKSEMVEIIHFTDFVFDGHFVFTPNLKNLYFPDKGKVEFTIITPSKILIFSNLKSLTF